MIPPLAASSHIKGLILRKRPKVLALGSRSAVASESCRSCGPMHSISSRYVMRLTTGFCRAVNLTRALCFYSPGTPTLFPPRGMKCREFRTLVGSEDEIKAPKDVKNWLIGHSFSPSSPFSPNFDSDPNVDLPNAVKSGMRISRKFQKQNGKSFQLWTARTVQPDHGSFPRGQQHGLFAPH